MSEVNPIPHPVQVPHNKTLMGVLCYLGILILVPYLMAKDDSFVKFHLGQGLVVFVIEAIAWVLGMSFMWHLYPLISLIQLVALVLSIIGIVNVVQGHEKALPLVGQYSSYFKL